MRQSVPVAVLALLTLLSLGPGCRAPRTDVAEALPDTDALAGEEYVHAASAATEAVPLARWWERFEDPVLDALVEEALVGNLDLRLAATRVLEADARARSARGGRGPAIDASLAASRSVNRFAGSPPLYLTVYSPQVSIAWQADLFGRLAAGERARVAEVLATQADRTALMHLLIAETARLRIEVSVLERRLALASDVERSRASTLSIVEGRYRRGVSATSAVAVHLARENLGAARAALPQTERALAQSHLALDVLLGRKPGTGPLGQDLAAPLPTAVPPPAGLPAALLDRRPDLQASRARVEAAAAEVDVTLAALYPDLTLSAFAGWSDDDFADLFSPETFIASMLGNLSAPLFASGRLAADVEVNEARLEGAVATYAAAVLQAVREVEDALVAERGLRAELEERSYQRDEALMAENLARDRYRRGLESLLTVLETERRRASADDQVLLLQAQVWNARIDLHLALGGDWFTADEETQ